MNLSSPYSFYLGFGNGISRPGPTGQSYYDWNDVWSTTYSSSTTAIPFSQMTWSEAPGLNNPTRYDGGGAYLTSKQRIVLFDGSG